MREIASLLYNDVREKSASYDNRKPIRIEPVKLRRCRLCSPDFPSLQPAHLYVASPQWSKKRSKKQIILPVPTSIKKMRIDLVTYFTGTAPTQICLDKRSGEAVFYLLSRREFHALQIARLTRHFLNVNLEKETIKKSLVTC
jgi:hypothetical protein